MQAEHVKAIACTAHVFVRINVGRRFDLDHVGAKIEDPAACRTGSPPRQNKDP
jgi:hypothetical protein